MPMAEALRNFVVDDRLAWASWLKSIEMAIIQGNGASSKSGLNKRVTKAGSVGWLKHTVLLSDDSS